MIYHFFIEKPIDSISMTSSDELLVNIGGNDSGEKFQRTELEAVQKQLKSKFHCFHLFQNVYIIFFLFQDEEERAKQLEGEAAILRREKAILISRFFQYSFFLICHLSLFSFYRRRIDRKERK